MSLPQAPTAVAKELAKFKPKNVFHEEKEVRRSMVWPSSGAHVFDSSFLQDGKRNSKIPSLTLLSLDVVAKNFARKQRLSHS